MLVKVAFIFHTKVFNSNRLLSIGSLPVSTRAPLNQGLEKHSNSVDFEITFVPFNKVFNSNGYRSIWFVS